MSESLANGSHPPPANEITRCAMNDPDDCFQNWAAGFTDWNLLLDHSGGPSHSRRSGCDAPLQANGTHFYANAAFFFMSHFSRYIVPGSTVVGAMTHPSGTPSPPPGHFWYVRNH